MMTLYSVNTVLVAYVAIASTQVVAVGTVTLSADARPIPGGYVVPERGNVTFTCNSSTGGALFWTIDLQTPGGSVTDAASRGLSSDLPNVSSQDTEPSANPASFTIHYIAPESNGSSVKCDDGTTNSSARILVEGSPTCPTIQTSVASEMLTVSLQKSSMTWLPQQYHVTVTSYNYSEVTAFNFTLTSNEPFDVTSLQPDTVYNISVTPCNIVGCNESCDIHSVQTNTPTNETRLPLHHNIFIGTSLAALVLLLAISACSSIPCLWHVARRKRRKKNGHSEGLHDKQISSEDVVNVQYAPFQLHGPDARLTTEHQPEEHSRDVTGNDDIAIVEDNLKPVYQPMKTSALPATMESNHSGGMTSSEVVMEGSPASGDQSLEETIVVSAKVESGYYFF